ncbi:MAG: flagellar motor switch protein FliN [Halieaceae bacterium]
MTTETESELAADEAAEGSLQSNAEGSSDNSAEGHAEAEAPAQAQASKRESDVNLDVLLDVPVTLSVEVGRTSMTIGELLETGAGTVLKLSRLINEPLDILVNNAPIAQGIVVMQDDKFGIQITDIISPQDRARNLQDSDPEAEPD